MRIERIVRTDVKAVILREKDLSVDEYRKLAVSVLDICRKCGKSCILHSHADIAVELSADGVHLTMNMLRNLKNKKTFTGVSCHSVAEAVEAETLGADYIIAGHIFATDCKKELAPRGLNFLSEVCRNVSIPVYAIGGINSNNIESVIDAGAFGSCIMSGFMRGENFGY